MGVHINHLLRSVPSTLNALLYASAASTCAWWVLVVWIDLLHDAQVLVSHVRGEGQI